MKNKVSYEYLFKTAANRKDDTMKKENEAAGKTIINGQYILDLSRTAIHLFLEKNIEAFLEYLDEDFVWVGDYDYLYMHSKEMFTNTIRQEAEAPPIDIYSEDYSVSVHSGAVWVIYGRCTAEQYDEGQAQMIRTKFHFTFVWQVRNKIPRLAQAMACHIGDAYVPENTKVKDSKVFGRSQALSVRADRRIAVREVGHSKIHYFTLSEIPYIQSENKYCIFHTAEGETAATCKPLRTYDDGSFVRIHNSYLVNPDYIRGIHGNMLILMNGEELPIGKKYRRELISALSHKFHSSEPEQSGSPE